MNNTHNRDSSPIDNIAVSLGLIKVVKGHVLLETNDILISDYRSYMIDLNFQRYFDETFSK